MAAESPTIDPAAPSDLRQACAEVERRLGGGQPCTVEDLFAAFPGLAADPESALELIYTEFVARERLGQRPDPADWCARFPRWRMDLEQLFEIHRAAGGGGLTTTTLHGGQVPALFPAGATGRRLGQYELLDEIGRGGMGVVYKARQLGFNRLVALKMILSGGHAGPEDLGRFRAEAEAVGRLQHPNIVQVYEVGEYEGRPFFSMEFCPGGSLKEKLSGTALPPREAAGLVETLARAVHAAHLQKVIHRDLKPANVLLAADGTPKVADFGLAKKLDEAGRTTSGAVMGTPSYMAPEQAQGLSKGVGAAADTYSLGTILYEALTGGPPFHAAAPQQTVLKVISEEPLAPRRLRPAIPRDLETICLKCLRKLPAQRYASSEALAEDCRRFLNGEPIQARNVSRAERVFRWFARRPAVTLLIGVSVLAAPVGATVGAAWFASREARPPSPAATAPTPAAAPKRDSDAIQGAWTVQMMEPNRVGLVNSKWVLTGDKLELHLPEDQPDEHRPLGSFCMDDTTTPKRILLSLPTTEYSMDFKTGKHTTRYIITTAMGIYKLEGDVLTICVGSGGADPVKRPSEFVAKGDSQWLLTLKRQ